MENQAISSQSEIKPTNTTSSIQPVVTSSKINPPAILVAVLISAIVFGLGGYFFGKQSSNNQQYAQNSIQPSPTSGIQDNTSKNTTSENKTFSGAWFSFQYPKSLFTISTNNEFLTFYQSLQAAQDAEKCVTSELGTIDHPCGEFMVFNIGVSKYPLNYQYSLKSSLTSTDPSLLKPVEWIDKNNRKWLLEGPVEIPGGSNLKAEYEDATNLYQISIQVGKAGFEQFSGKTLDDTNQLQASKEILDTFSKTE